MAGQASQDFLNQTVDGFAQRVQEYAQGIASRLGQPLSGTQLSQDEVVQRWNFSPLGNTQTADAAYHQLVATGTPPGQALSQVYPMRQMLIQGSDLNDSIARAKQISGWAAKATGTPEPEPFEGSTMPLALQQQAQQRAAATPVAAVSPPPVAPSSLPAPPVGLPPSAPSVPLAGGTLGGGGGIPAMAGGGVVTQPTVALIGEAGPEAVVPLHGPSVQESLSRIGGAIANPSSIAPSGTDIQQYIATSASARGIDPLVALAVAYNEGGLNDPAARGTFKTGSSWWPFQLHYGGNGYNQYGNVAGLGNEFTAQTGYHPGDPAAWRASVDFALDTALKRGWYPTWYGSKPAGVSTWQGIPQQQAA